MDSMPLTSFAGCGMKIMQAIFKTDEIHQSGAKFDVKMVFGKSTHTFEAGIKKMLVWVLYGQKYSMFDCGS